MQRSVRQRAYSWIMGGCLALILPARNVVPFWSTTASALCGVVLVVLPRPARRRPRARALDSIAPRSQDEVDRNT